jgi:hypothetical protein
MHLYRRLLVLLVIPFSLLNPVGIQAWLDWQSLDKKTACIVGGGVGLLAGIGATYVLAKKYCENQYKTLLKDADTKGRDVGSQLSQMHRQFVLEQIKNVDLQIELEKTQNQLLIAKKLFALEQEKSTLERQRANNFEIFINTELRRTNSKDIAHPNGSEL